MRLLLTVAFLVAALHPTPALAARLALIISVGAYDQAALPADQRWGPLASGNDADVLRAVLLQRGFDDVVELRDAQATRAGIEAALAALARRAAPGDHVLVHYSGHGQQLTDDDGGEELDGYDEALVPFDAPRAPPAGYRGETHLRDEDLGALLDGTRTRVGPQGSVAVVLDSCHSGTATRGGTVRGGPVMDLGAAPASRGDRGVEEGGGWDAQAASGQKGSLVVLSAARSNQVARETSGPDGKPMGALSLALAGALTRTPAPESWANLHELVQQEMATSVPGQAPQVEGAVHMGLFGAASSDAGGYHRLTWLGTEGRAELAAGRLHDLAPGAKVEVHAAGAAQPGAATLLATGTVESVELLKSYVKLDRVPSAEKVEALRVWVTEWATGDLRLRVQLNLPPGPARDRATAALGPLANRLDLVADANVAAFTVDWSSGRYRILQNGDEHGTGDLHASVERGDDPAALADHLLALSRSALLRNFTLDGAGERMDLRLVPAEVDTNGVCRPAGSAMEPATGGRVRMTEGQVVGIQLQHAGTATVSPTVVYVDATGRPAQIYPELGRAPDLVPPGAAPAVVGCVRVTPPYGMEQLLVIASKDRIDLGPVLGYARSESTRGPGAGALQALLDQYGSGTRGEPITRVATSQGYAASLFYEVVPRQAAKAP